MKMKADKDEQTPVSTCFDVFWQDWKGVEAHYLAVCSEKFSSLKKKATARNSVDL